MKIIKYSIICLLMTILSNCKAQSLPKSSTEEFLYRPNFHFTPKSNWMNDPNGMFYLEGTYHLFFQYYPEGNKWGPMHWGHATSKDLIKWKEQKIALYPDHLGYIFSGSAVVDKNNTSGFGNGKNTPIVAIFTYHNIEKEKEHKIDVESQGIAYSIDNGKNWIKYSNNPVLKNPGIRDFRDPKVIWDIKRQQWLMVLAAQNKVHFYTSKNLKDWNFISDFGYNIGAHGGVWECPDIFPIKVKETNEEKWVLMVSINPGGPNGGSATQYFVGDFDGKSFKPDNIYNKQLEGKEAIWLDWGKDNYASVTWNNAPNGKRLMIGWMSNWDYAQEVPTEKWRSANTIAREIILTKNNEEYLLKTMPVQQLSKYKTKKIIKNIPIEKSNVLIKKDEIELDKTVLELNLKNLKNDTYIFTLSNKLGEKLFFGINNAEHYLFIDRQFSGITNFGNDFANKISKAPLSRNYKEASLKVLLDKTSLEIFFNNGEKVMTEMFFPREKYSELSISTEAIDAKISLKAHQINIK